MKWSEISIHTTNEAVEPIANILYEAGASGIVIEDSFDLNKDHPDQYGELYELNPDDFPEEGVIVKAYLPVNSFLGETVEQIKSAINNLLLFNIDIGLNKVTISEVHEEEWSTAWKKYYHPVKISSKFTIVPTWEEYEPVSSDELMIELDPGMAFGTGTHPTTVMSIQALEQTVKKDDIVYDVGTGSGVLSIASAMHIKINHIQDRITVKQNNLLDGITEPADVIVANLLAEIIVRFTDDAFRLVKDGGYFITSGIINQKRQEVEEQIIKAGFEIVETIMMEDWVTIVAKK